MALDLSGFQAQPQQFGGLYQAADTLERRRKEDERLKEEKEGRQAATSKFLTNYLDSKDHLTGTPYDPQIVNGLQGLLQQGQELASKGASTTDILMALGPKVAQINQYQTKAKLINDQIKGSVQRIKQFSGYNPEAVESEAKKAAFYGPDGKLKDISTVDPNTDWVSYVAQNSPEAITSGKGLDDLVSKTPMADYSRSVTTAYGGRNRTVKYEAKHPFWEDLQTDDKGNIATDATGNPLGLGVKGSSMVDDKGNPIVNQQTGNPYQVIDKNYFNAIMSHNPDVADYVRGQVNKYFKDAGAKNLPPEGSPQWDMMARHILHDELETRKRSTFKTIDQAKETAPAIKVELGRDPNALDAMANYESAIKLKGDYAYLNPKTGKTTKTNAVQTVGQIFNNNPDFLQGETKDLPDGRTVIDVTTAFPGGGLKSGRGEDDVYKNIYYDPNKRTLIVESQSKTKDASGQKPTSLEEIPESKAGLFMARIAAANGVDPDKLNDLFGQMGYRGAKFNSPQDAGSRTQQEHQQRIQDAVKAVDEDKFDALKGTAVKDGTIEKVNSDRWTFGGLRDAYSITIRGADGKTKTVTFKDKDEFKKYISQSSTQSDEQKYTTNLSPAEEKQYQQWRQKLPGELKNDKDYDLRGQFKENPNVKPSENLHFQDTYKRPNHITFSDQSQYHDPNNGIIGGHWGVVNGKDVFYASKRNIDNAGGWDKLQNYFKTYEPNIKLIAPKPDGTPNLQNNIEKVEDLRKKYSY